MRKLVRPLPGSQRLAILCVLLAALTVVLALGYAGILPSTSPWYPALHAAMEACSVVLALLVFAVVTHAARKRVPAGLALLSSSALAVGLLGIGHLLTIPVLPGAQASVPAASTAAFWVGARGIAALALLVAALVPAACTIGARTYRVWVVGACAVAAWGYWLALGGTALVPPSFVSVEGLTASRLAFEYLLIGMNVAAALLLLLRSRHAPTRGNRYLATAAVVAGLSGINFTLYLRPDDLSNIVAHLYKLLAVLCLHRAVFAEVLRAAPAHPAVVEEGRRAGLSSAARDVARLQPAVVRRLAQDPLGALPDRHRALEVLGEAIDAAGAVAVLVLDIDGLRKINSHYGWTGGEDVLHECVARLSARLGADDMLARQGDNEFIVVRRHSSRDNAAALARALQDCMRRPFAPGGNHVFLSVSVGIAILPAEPCQPAQLLQMAQLASACARTDGPAHLCFYSASMEGSIRERIDLETMLSHAVEREQFVLQYQPRISVKNGSMVGVEALVRWRHPALGLLAPARFIPIAEESGLINELDLWVLREACTRAAAWRAQGLFDGRISVNLSARQFQQPGLAQRVRAALEASGLAPGGLELEITESTVMHDTEEATEVLRSLRELGVSVSIDDFGTGYSSLSYLKRFPLDVLKIDRAFVNDMGDATGAAIIRAIITLAHSLGLAAVAEGVETAEQVAFLKENNCDQIQGYYFSRPIWPEQLASLLMQETQAVC